MNQPFTTGNMLTRIAALSIAIPISLLACAMAYASNAIVRFARWLLANT